MAAIHDRDHAVDGSKINAEVNGSSFCHAYSS